MVSSGFHDWMKDFDMAIHFRRVTHFSFFTIKLTFKFWTSCWQQYLVGEWRCIIFIRHAPLVKACRLTFKVNTEKQQQFVLNWQSFHWTKSAAYHVASFCTTILSEFELRIVCRRVSSAYQSCAYIKVVNVNNLLLDPDLINSCHLSLFSCKQKLYILWLTHCVAFASIWD